MRSPRIWLGASITVGTALVAWSTLRPLLARVGHPGATLDDAYIHFQYARAYAEGHPLRFQAGEPRSSGGTSFMWPAVLAVFYLAGLHGESIVGAAWALSFVALGGLAWEASALTRRLTGSETAAFFAAALVVAFSPFAWFAASGMEVVPFAWTLARLARLTAEEADDTAEPAAATATAAETHRLRGRRVQIVAFAWLAPLVRPEGAALTLLAALVLLTCQRRRGLVARLLLAAPVAAGAVLPSVLLFATTGQLTSSTAQVKLLSGDPYLHGARAWFDAVASNVVVAVTDLLDGGVYSSEFLPAHGAFLLLTGLAAIAVCSRLSARRARAHAWMVLGLAALLFVPCTYVTFLWNRLRYLWPFATGWIVGVACLAALVAQTVVRLLPVDLRWPRLEPLLTATLLAVALFLVALHLPVAIADVADSASGIDRQQASLGRWVKANVPADERVGVNDTGAIAYFGEHRTFDIVGLTSPLEGKYWVAGPASRFEHYEDLSAAGGRLPGFWAVYPNWFGLPSLLGEPLATREVRASILGGVVMSVFRSNGAVLGSGARPWSLPPSSRVVDEVDVADIDSEGEHLYALLGATLGEEVMGVTTLDNGLTVVDGGRGRRTVESFAVNLAASPGDGGGCTGILRYASDAPFAMAVGTASFSVPAAELDEVTYPVPAARCGDRLAPLELRFSHPIAVFHHWFTRPYAK